MKKRPEYSKIETGKNLRKLREERHLTAKQVRDYMQLGSVQAVYKWERGECFPQADNLMALALLYEVKPEMIMIQQNKSAFDGVFSYPNANMEKIRIRRMERYYFWLLPLCGTAIISDRQTAGFLRRRLLSMNQKEILVTEDCMVIVSV